MPEPQRERDEYEPQRADQAARKPRRESPPQEVPDTLRGGDVHDRLARIEDGDPLEIHARARIQLRAEGLFLDAERLALRTMARAALFAPEYDGVPGLDDWLVRIIKISIKDLLREQEDEEYHRVSVDESPDKEYYLRFAEIAKLPAKYGRLACLVMNQLPREDRLTFFAIVLEGKSVNRWAAEGHGPPRKIKNSLRDIGLRMLSVLDRAERDGGDGGVARGI